MAAEHSSAITFSGDMLYPYVPKPLPPEFAPRLGERLRSPVSAFKTPTARVLHTLKRVLPQIRVAGFRASARAALWAPAAMHYLGEEARRLLPRMERRFGVSRTRKYFQEDHESLQPWSRSSDYLTPDAYLVDLERETIVACEVEEACRSARPAAARGGPEERRSNRKPDRYRSPTG